MRVSQAVHANHHLLEGATLWTERPAAAWQYLGSRSQAMACRHSLRFVGSLAEQLQVACAFTEAEESAGTATLDRRLATLLEQDVVAAARSSRSFVVTANEQIFANSECRSEAQAAYNW